MWKMQSVKIKLVQILCIVFIFGQIKGDVQLLEGSFDDRQIEYVAGCTAQCMQRSSTAVLSGCYDSCTSTNQTLLLKEINSTHEQIRLICREVDSLTIGISGLRNNASEHQIYEKPFKNSTFLFKIQRNSSENQLRLVYLSDSPIMKIEQLQRNTIYTVAASIFSGNLEYLHLSHVKSFKTLDNESYVPNLVSNDTIKLNYDVQNESGVLFTTITWDPTEDMSCMQLIHLYATREENDFIEPNFRKLQPFELYHLEEKTLKFETEYIMEIHGVNGKHPYIEGNRSIFEFTTPTCWQFYGFDLQKCRPPPLSNILSTNEHFRNDSYRINVTWDMPNDNPDYYEVLINQIKNEGNSLSQNVSGSMNYAYFPEVNTTDGEYDVQIVAVSKGGYTANDIVKFSLNHQRNFKGQHSFIPILAICILVICILLLLIQNRRNRMRLEKEIFSKEMYLREFQSKYKDDMEIDPSNVELIEILGEGAFGVVRKGLLKPTNMAVAVKMLKEKASDEDIKGFLSEIVLMKSVEHHENILRIVGHSTKSYDKLMLLTEYCSEGNLLGYLRKFRGDSNYMLGANDQTIQYPESNMQNIIFNRLYDEQPLEEPQFVKLHSCNISYENETDIVAKKIVKNPEVFLFVENQAYGLLEASKNSIQTGSLNKDDHQMKSQEVDQQKNVSYLTVRDLLMFAKQIAIGMEILANNKIVHRDLAARNILVCADKTVKIADFGLSRDIYYEEVYMKLNPGRVPIKWLALESMIDKTYTSQSDVWSYGILLYEIVTMGSEPYPTIKSECLPSFLQAGNRMAKPHHCSQEFYELMLSCWQSDANKRPKFAEISLKIDQFIDKVNGFLVDGSESAIWSNEVNKS